jgi:RNA polymerase sigma-70 factor (ECF subfamily)
MSDMMQRLWPARGHGPRSPERGEVSPRAVDHDAPVHAEAPAHAATRPPFAELYREHFDFVWRSLRHLGVAPHALDDAAQEVWLAVHRRLPEFEARSRPSTWLFGIALNVARSQRRKTARSGASVPIAEEIPSRGPDPEKVLVGQDAWSQVQTFLNTLDELPRAIFVSALLENLSAAETAEAIGVEVGLVYKRVRALRRAFMRQLQRSEGSST